MAFPAIANHRQEMPRTKSSKGNCICREIFHINIMKFAIGKSDSLFPTNIITLCEIITLLITANNMFCVWITFFSAWFPFYMWVTLYRLMWSTYKEVLMDFSITVISLNHCEFACIYVSFLQHLKMDCLWRWSLGNYQNWISVVFTFFLLASQILWGGDWFELINESILH